MLYNPQLQEMKLEHTIIDLEEEGTPHMTMKSQMASILPCCWLMLTPSYLKNSQMVEL